MTREEFSLIVKGLKAVYANPSFIPDKDAFNVWYELLSDIPYDLASKATQVYMMSETKIPTPADIRKKAQFIGFKGELNELEAWALVSKAIKNGYYGAEKEFDNLPETVQSAVGSPSNLRNWATTDIQSIENVVQSNFLRSYRAEVKRRAEYNALSPDIQRLIENIKVRGMKSIESK